MHHMTTTYKCEITVHLVENGFVIKNSNPQSLISKVWIAKTKEELISVITTIAELLNAQHVKS